MSYALLIAAAHPLVHVNATLNTIATLLLVAALVQIRRGNELAHANLMRAALGVSAAFLGCYLYYHYQVGSVKFTHKGVVRYIYLAILASHVLLAMTVPILALWAALVQCRAIRLTPSAQANSEPATAEWSVGRTQFGCTFRSQAWWCI